jgi:hypothetical protein
MRCWYFEINQSIFISECDELIVTNGNLNDSVRTYGTVVGVDCNEGYVIREDAVIECRVDGSWSGVPNCDPIGKLWYYIHEQVLY